MRQYLDALQYVLDHGVDSDDRTGTGTLSVFGYQNRYDLSEGFPAMTTRKLPWKAIVGELLWFLEGSVDERRLAELTFGQHKSQLTDKRTIWTANAEKQGKELGYVCNDRNKNLGTIYGSIWRGFSSKVTIDGDIQRRGMDQLFWAINQIKNNPNSRRIIVSAWNPDSMQDAALPPCHSFFQFYVRNGRLSTQMYQRSADAPLGVPANIASYALLTHLIARECELEVGDFVHTFGDLHIYKDQVDLVREHLQREPYDLPTLEIDDSFDLVQNMMKGFPLKSIDKIRLKDYNYNPKQIKYPFSV